MRFHRRQLLAGTALLLLNASPGRAVLISGELPWAPAAPAVTAKQVRKARSDLQRGSE